MSNHGGPPTLAGFRITGKLGEGGMGAVWRAVQLGTNRAVAIKTITAGNLSDLARQRFALEIEVTAQLEHPNIARLYESRIDDGQCFYAMEFIDGQDLEVYLEQDKPEPRVYLEIMLDVCRALQYAHQRAIIHRDLKPGNVMMTREKVPKVVDFGLAKLVEDKSPNAADKITGEGMAVGTPAYMSPEQIKAKEWLIDTRTDVYALGVMLYEYLAGRHPHQEALDSGTMNLFMSVVQKTAPPLRDFRKDIDKDLDAVVMKAIANDAADRYATAGDLANDLDRYLTGEPVLAQPQTTFYLLRKKIAKNRGKVALAAAVFLSFIAFAVLSLQLIIEERDAARVAKATAESERDKSEARFILGRDFAHQLIFELDDRLVEGPTAARASLVKSGGEYLVKLKKDAGDRPDLLSEIAQVYNKIGEVQRQQGDVEGAMASYKQALTNFKNLARIDPPNVVIHQRGQADSHFLLARGEGVLGKPAKAKKHYKSALKILEALSKANPKDSNTEDQLVKVYLDSGKLQNRQGDQDKAAENFSRALEIRKKRVKKSPKDTTALKNLASSYLVLGNLRLDQGRPASALKNYRRSLKLREKLVELAPDNTDFRRRLGAGHRGVGYAYEEQGNLAKASESYERALKTYKTQSNNDPTNARLKLDVLWSYLFLVNTHIQNEKLDAAMDQLKEAIPLAKTIAEADKKNKTVQRMLARLLSMGGTVLDLKGDKKRARKNLDQAFSITEPMIKANKKDLYALDLHSEVLLKLGEVELKSKKVKDAETHTFDALDMRRDLVKASPDDKAYKKALGIALTDAGMVLVALKQKDAADEHFVDAEKIFRELLKIDETNAGARTGIVRALVARGDMHFGGKKKPKAGEPTQKGCASYQSAEKEIRRLAIAGALLPSIKAASEKIEKLGLDKTCR